MWCWHRWEERGRYFAKGVPITHTKGIDPESFMEMAVGITSIILKCRKCGDVKTEKVLGDAR